MSLDTQCKAFNIVINKPSALDNELFIDSIYRLFEECKRNTYIFAGILHNKDTDKCGSLKTLHYHLILKCSNRYRISTMLYKLLDMLGWESVPMAINTIHITKLDSLPLSIQYLTHKNDTDKYQYEYTDILTNLSADDMKELYDSKADTEITVKYLTHLVKDGRSDFEIMTIIGLGRYHLFKGAINDIRYALQYRPNEVNSFLQEVDNNG